MSIILAIIVFGIIIAIHEFGHFFMAKLFKVGVMEYAIGMGPMIFGKRIGETVYSLRAIPFGGYCAMYGEESLEAGNKGEEQENNEEENKKKLFKRKIEYKTDWTEDRSYNSKTPLQRILILFAGPFANLILGFSLALLSTGLWGNYAELNIKEVYQDSPAMEVGLEVGDVIVAINDRNVLTFNDYEEYKLTHNNLIKDGYSLTIERNGETLTKFVKQDETTGLIGIRINTEIEKKNFPDSFKYALNDTKYWCLTVFDSIYMLVNGEASVKDMSGAVGITSMMGDTIETASEHGTSVVVETIFTLIMFISINLGIMNLLPFPALDGGRILFTTIEIIINRKIPTKIEAAVNGIGMACLMVLMVITLFNDIGKIIM